MPVPPEPPVPHDLPSQDGHNDRDWVASLLLKLGITPDVVAEFNEPFTAHAADILATESVAAEFSLPMTELGDAESDPGDTALRRYFVRAYDEDNQFVREIDVRAPDADEALRLAIRQRFSNEVLFDPPSRATRRHGGTL